MARRDARGGSTEADPPTREPMNERLAVLWIADSGNGSAHPGSARAIDVRDVADDLSGVVICPRREATLQVDDSVGLATV